TSIKGTDSLIQKYLGDLRRNVRHFTSNHEDKLKQLVDQPKDDALHKDVSDLVKMYFPGSATFTIANSQGEILLDDIDTLIGKGCQENIRLFSINSKQSDAQLRIHSDRLDYHFDIMQEMHTSDGRVMIFFVSFAPDDIAGFISNFRLPGHQLLLIKQDANGLIEITEKGARVKLARDKYLTAEEQERVLAEMDVANTLWQIIDIIDKSSISDAKYIVYRDFIIIFSAFVLGLILSAVAFLKHERPIS
ncbi:MAG: hypothetical protein KAI17_04810, partial [Thiotrichaceae bacterium]|nr:hypothetical protein [Thiotrichaceae bacterium]